MSGRRKLGRRTEHYWALMKNLSIALVEHGRIETTISKAKELRRYIDPLITLAKTAFAERENVKGLNAYKKILSKLFNNRKAANKLISIGQSNQGRNGGYTSMKRIGIRKGDCSVKVQMRIIDYVNESVVDSSLESNGRTENSIPSE